MLRKSRPNVDSMDDISDFCVDHSEAHMVPVNGSRDRTEQKGRVSAFSLCETELDSTNCDGGGLSNLITRIKRLTL